MARGKGRDKRQDFNKNEANDAPTEENGGMTKDKFVKFHKRVAALKSDSDELRGEIGQEFKQFEEDGGAKRPYKTAAKWAALPEDKREDEVLTTFKYADELGVFAQGDLLDKAKDILAKAFEEIAALRNTAGGSAAAPEAPSIPKGASAH